MISSFTCFFLSLHALLHRHCTHAVERVFLIEDLISKSEIWGREVGRLIKGRGKGGSVRYIHVKCLFHPCHFEALIFE